MNAEAIRNGYVVGVDGGGTGCRVTLATSEGKVLGKGTGGSANITTNLQGARDNIMACVSQALNEAGLPETILLDCAAVLGLAGANVGTFATDLRATLPFALCDIVSDATIALQGALGDGDGAIAILGTGSAYMCRTGAVTRLIGGWGFQLSDVGGGARLGREALEVTLLAHDKVVPHTELTHAILARFDNVPENLTLFAQTAKPVDYGKFAPLIFECAANKDANAQAIIKQATQNVDASLDAIVAGGIERIALLGGLAKLFAPCLSGQNRAMLVEPKANALQGAVDLARKLATHGQTKSGGPKR
jgi:glucosamine kinase